MFKKEMILKYRKKHGKTKKLNTLNGISNYPQILMMFHCFSTERTQKLNYRTKQFTNASSQGRGQ